MIVQTDSVAMPTWAICYIEYGDSSDMTDEEAAMVDKWLTRYRRPIFRYGEEEFFSHRPAFGLPCTCVTVDISEDLEGAE